MLLIVFGAGASYDSVPHLPAPNPPSEGQPHWEDRPPLANHLFDTRKIFVDLMGRFKDCQPLVPILRQSGTSVEKTLAGFREQAKTFPPANRELAAIQFYLHFALWDCQARWRDRHKGITNFSTLLREIERWRYENNEQVCFVTFNYDTMLEEAMAQVLHLEVADMESYYKWKHYSLFKLHGSVNWGRVVAGIHHDVSKGINHLYQRLIDEVVPGSDRITIQYRLCDHELRAIPLDLGPHAQEETAHMALYPAISIPVEKKDEFSCPPGHVTALKAILPKVTKMITIGWRATEAEFLTKLQDSRLEIISGIRQLLKILVVTGSQDGAEQTTRNLRVVASLGESQYLLSPETPRVTTGFTGLINDLEALRVFLR